MPGLQLHAGAWYGTAGSHEEEVAKITCDQQIGIRCSARTSDFKRSRDISVSRRCQKKSARNCADYGMQQKKEDRLRDWLRRKLRRSQAIDKLGETVLR